MSAFEQKIGTDEQDPYYSGDTLRLRFTATENGKEDGPVVDLTDFGLVWVLVDSETGAEQVRKSVSGGGVTLIDPSNGRAEVHVEPADTEALEGWHNWEAEATSPGGDVQTVATGTLPIRQDLIE